MPLRPLVIGRRAFAAIALSLVLLPAVGRADTVKRARSTDIATEYRLEGTDLYRMVDGQKCQVTTDVIEFKVSQHPDDAAVIYYLRRERGAANLYSLENTDGGGQCPKAKKHRILDDIARSGGRYKYSVVPSAKAEIVAVALSRQGTLVAWDEQTAVVEEQGVEDYRLHDRFGKAGAPFRRYVAFAIDSAGFVLKLDGRAPRGSRYDSQQPYPDLDAFWAINIGAPHSAGWAR